MNAQQIIAANVAARGYRDGWTTEQFVARQLCKFQEELHEAASQVRYSSGNVVPYWIMKLHSVGWQAKAAFDDTDGWDNVEVIDGDRLRSELADMLVVLLTAAEALDFDVIQAAIDKSAADVARGVRNGK